MKYIDNIINAVAKYKVGKIPRDGGKAFYNLSNVQKINILYYLNEPFNIDAKGQYKDIFALIEDLRLRGIKYEFTFFVDNSVVEAKRINMNPFTKKDISALTLCPNSKVVDDFLMEDSDVLINLSPVTCWPLEYLAQYSKSPFKISVQREVQGAEYDFLFKPSEETTFPLGVYKQIISYLEVINK